MGVHAVYREPFSLGLPAFVAFQAGLSLEQMRSEMGCLPESFDDFGVICINGHPVNRALWGVVRPKADAEVSFHLPPMGGGDSSKNPVATIAAVALTIATGSILTGSVLGGLTGATAAKTTFAALSLAAGVSYAGSLLISALIPPPSLAMTDSTRGAQSLDNASAAGNVLEPNGVVPRVVGRRKVYPPLASEPFTYYSGPDEIVEALYILAGPHQLTDIRANNVDVAAMSGVEYEVREGWPGDERIKMVTRQARTEEIGSELRGFTVNSDDDEWRQLYTATGDLPDALPQPQVLATKPAPDEHQIQLVWQGGLSKTDDPDVRMRVPFRFRLRSVETGDWVNLPELHYQAATYDQLRATVRLVWGDGDAVYPSSGDKTGWVEARVASPGQTSAPVSDDWAADGYFVGAGDAWLSAGNVSASGVRNVEMDRWTATIHLDRAVFPPGRYEVEITRGVAIRLGKYSSSSYQYDGSVWDLFGYRGSGGTGQIAETKKGLSDTVGIARSVSIWNEHPLPTDDFAVIAVRAKNRPINTLSAIAGGYVRDWDGAAWAEWVVTDNPAPHLRDIFVGQDNYDPVPVSMIDDAGLVDWRQACIDLGYRCNALLEDQTVDDAARIVAACGYARPYMAEIWGVTRDLDRSGMVPVQIFNPRNSAGFQWTKAFPRLPEGFRVSYRDSLDDYSQRQITVFRPGESNDTGRTEQETIEGLVTEDEVRVRAIYDLRQAEHRGVYYTFDAPAEAIICRRGDLVGMAHDMLSAQHGAARIAPGGLELDGSGGILAITLDVPVPVFDEPYIDEVPNLATVGNIATLGLKSGVVVRRAGGATTHPVSQATGSTRRLQFDPPIPAEGLIDEYSRVRDALVTVGALGREQLRLVVFSIEPKQDFEFSITCVDEAPEIWNQPDSPGVAA